MINKLALKNFYETHRDAYKKLRSSDTWDESYKWRILPGLNKTLQEYDAINPENAAEIIAILQKANPNAGSFCHWIDFDNMQKLIEKKPVAAKALVYLWKPTNVTAIGSEVDSVNKLLNNFFAGSFRLSPAALGYFLAAQDCENFSIYSEKLIQTVSDVNMASKPKAQGEKYQLHNDTCRYIGSLMREEQEQYGDQTFYMALNGQDFLYVTTVYENNGQRKEV